MNKVFCIGELLIDLINNEAKAGGAPANVCACVSKLGGKSYFLGQVGDDDYGKFLLDILESVNINTDMVVKYGNTTIAMVTIDENGEREFYFIRGSDGDYLFDSINLEEITSKDIVHFGSATGFLEGELKNTYFKLLNYCVENDIFISFDANYREALIEDNNLNSFIKDCKEFIKYSNFVKLSEEELKIITNQDDLEKGVKELHEIGANIVAITLGSKGTLISTKEYSKVISSIDIEQIDSTGAGDAFVGAVLKQVAQEEDKRNISFDKWIDIVFYANVVGAITCTGYGAIEPIPKEKDIHVVFH